MRRNLAMGAIGLALAVAGCSSTPAPPAVDAGYVSSDGSVTQWQPAERGDPVTLSGTTVDGTELTTADWAGIVVVNFWYAGCPPCRAEAPELAAIATDYPDAHFLGVNSVDEAETAAAFEATFEVPYPTLLDRDMTATAALAGVVPLQAFPTTVVLADGQVAARIIGQLDSTTLRALLDEVSAE